MQRDFSTSAPRRLFRLFKKFTKCNKRTLFDRRGRHTKESRLLKLKKAVSSFPKSPTCNGCHSPLDFNSRTVEGDAMVCTKCGVVDEIVFYDDEPPSLAYLRCSPLYRHRNYFAERILQARNEEPRIRDEELDILSHVNDIYKRSSLLFWNDRFFSKKHCALICNQIHRAYGKTVFTRRSERWYQFRVFICGPTGATISHDLATVLRFLFDAYSKYFEIYLKENNIGKSNITQLDLVILALLYNISPYYVNEFGWYFLNHNIINKTESVYKNYREIQTIFGIINERILKEYFFSVPSACYQWFRENPGLILPDLEDLIDCALYSQLGAIQYANYCKQNQLGSYLFYSYYVTERPNVNLINS